MRLPLLPHQVNVMQSFARIIILTAGLGAGKTFTFLWWGMQCAFINKPHRIALFEPTFPMVRSILVPTAETVCDMAGIEYHWVPSLREFRFMVNGEQLTMTFGGASNPDHVKGPNLAGVGIDEAGQVKTEVIQHALKRVRVKEVPLLQSFLCGTPERMSGRFFEMATGATDLYAARLANGYAERIRARSFDNPYLDDDYVKEELSDFTPEEAALYVDGDFVPLSGRAYPYFQPDMHIVSVGDWRDGDLILACDFNVTPMTWLLGVRRRRRTGPMDERRSFAIHWFKEYIRSNAFTFDVANEVAHDLSSMLSTNFDYWSPERAAKSVTVYCDASGSNRSSNANRTDVEHLRRAGFRVIVDKSNPAVLDRANTVNYALKKQRMFFDPRCEEAIRCFIGQGRDPLSGHPDKSEGLDHATDAVGYAAWKVYPRPRPKGNVPVTRYT